MGHGYFPIQTNIKEAICLTECGDDATDVMCSLKTCEKFPSRHWNLPTLHAAMEDSTGIILSISFRRVF